jgi:hypothetical protein
MMVMLSLVVDTYNSVTKFSVVADPRHHHQGENGLSEN